MTMELSFPHCKLHHADQHQQIKKCFRGTTNKEAQTKPRCRKHLCLVQTVVQMFCFLKSRVELLNVGMYTVNVTLIWLALNLARTGIGAKEVSRAYVTEYHLLEVSRQLVYVHDRDAADMLHLISSVLSV